MDKDFMDAVVEAREMCGFPWPVTSGYRCPQHNNNVSTTGKAGPHTTGHSIDVQVYGGRVGEIIDAILMCDIYIPEEHGRGSIGFMQHGKHKKRYIHIDNLRPDQTTGPRPTIFSYP